MSDLQFYRDEDGVARAAGEDHRLASFLESDIQDAIEIAQVLLALLNQPEEAEFHGNVYSVSIDPITVRLSNNADEEAVDRRLTREEFAKALKAWCAYIE